MKTKVYIKFDATKIPGFAPTILDAAGCGPDVADIHDYTIYDVCHVVTRLELDEGDPRIDRVLAQLARHGEPVEMFTYTEYSEEDRQSARLLWMVRDIHECISAGLRYGTKYDMTNACPQCGTGARQTSALYIDGEDGPARVRKHRAVGSWDHDLLVDGGMVKKLKDAGITGISFGDVRARLKNKKWSAVARDQILIEHVMPPMRSELTDDDKKSMCQVCRRGGRAMTPEKPYREEDLVGMQDFNLTWEWFGDFWPKDKKRNRVEKRPSPQVLVTPRVMNIFREAGVKTFQWTPAFVET